MEQTEYWNRFIEELCYKELSDLTAIQRDAVMCFWYDAEVNSGGHSVFFDCYPDMDLTALENALQAISNQQIADNLRNAISDGQADDYAAADQTFYAFSPELTYYIEAFVIKNKEQFFI